MHSKIYQSDRIANQQHEFGEADEYRYPALFVRDDGTESVILLTPKQVVEAENRGSREQEDVAVFRDRISQHKRARTISAVIGAVLFVAVFATFATILKWG